MFAWLECYIRISLITFMTRETDLGALRFHSAEDWKFQYIYRNNNIFAVVPPVLRPLTGFYQNQYKLAV